MNNIDNSANKYLKLYVVGLLIILGLCIRIYGLLGSVWSNTGYDEQRDTLVVSHIVRYGESLTRGPHASTDYLMYPPTYYYLLSVVWFLIPNIYGLKIIWLLFSLFSILLAYRLGNLIVDSTTGIIFSMLVVFHPVFIVMSQQITPPYILPTLSFILAILLLQKKQTASTLSLSMVIITLAFHIHYSILIVAPFLFFWWIMEYIRFLLRIKSNFRIIPFVIAAVSVSVWIMLSYRNTPFDQVDLLKYNSFSLNELFTRLNEVLRTWINVLFYVYDVPLKYTLLILVVIYVQVLIFIITKAKAGIIHTRAILAFILFSSFPLVIASGYAGTMTTGYLVVILPFGLFIVALWLRVLFKFNRIIAALVTGMVVYIFVNGSGLFSINTYAKSYYRIMMNIAEHIVKDSDRIAYPADNNYDFDLMFITEQPILQLDDWQTGGIWFHLERLTKKRLVRLVDINTNFVPINTHPKYRYIICDSRLLHSAGVDADQCDKIETQLSSLPLGKPTKVFREHEFMVWRTVLQ